jgi:hypothetical protein
MYGCIVQFDTINDKDKDMLWHTIQDYSAYCSFITNIKFMRLIPYLCICLLPMISCSKNKAPITEKYGDSLVYTIQDYSYTEGNCNDTTSFGMSKCAELQLQYPVFEEGEFADIMNESIQHSLLGMQFTPDTVASVEELRDAFFESYKQTVQEFSDAMPHWTSERTVLVLLNRFPLISLQTDVSEYLGGAHPNTYIALSMFDMRNGKVLTMDDIILSEKKNELTAMVEKEFRLQKKLAPAEDLSERFFFEKDRFHLPANIVCTPEGILFFYNNYEVAAYAEGQTEIILSYKSIRPFLRKNTAVWEYVQSLKK